jgi:hypothetical protein
MWRGGSSGFWVALFCVAELGLGVMRLAEQNRAATVEGYDEARDLQKRHQRDARLSKPWAMKWRWMRDGRVMKRMCC